MITTQIVIILTLNYLAVEPFGMTALKKLKQKAKDAYKKKFGRGKTSQFLGYDLTEYPGTNERYRRMNENKWDDYYECLKAQNLGTDLTMTPDAILGFQGNSIGLDCKLCLSPSEIMKLDSAEWIWAPHAGGQLEPVEYTENILLSPEDRTLRMYDLKEELTGQYICKIGEAQASPYFLTVVPPNDDELLQVHPHDAPLGPYPQPVETIAGHEIVLDTQYGPWSGCSKCNQIGRRHRLGYCTVKYRENSGERPKHSKNQTEPIEIAEDDYEIIRTFDAGIPCESHVLPAVFRTLNQIKQRKDEIVTGFCKIECPEARIFEVRDKKGNVIERVNNSAGIYSMTQGVPPEEPPVERQLQYAIKGKPAVLTCPGNLNSDTPVQWQIGSMKVIPELLAAESKGRIYVSITDKIHIKDAHVSDSSIYSCWQMHQLAGTVRLIVEKKISLDFNHHLMLVGMVLIFATFLFVFVKAFFGRKQAIDRKR